MKNKMTDLQLKAQKAILDDSRTKNHGIEALDNNGIIILKGRVPSRKVSHISKNIVEDVSGVTGVINELEVQVGEERNI